MPAHKPPTDSPATATLTGIPPTRIVPPRSTPAPNPPGARFSGCHQIAFEVSEGIAGETDTMASIDISFMSAGELAHRIRSREFSPVEVIEAAIANIEKRNPSLNAIVYLGFE